MSMMGICCGCERPVALVRLSRFFVTVPHDFCGAPCMGEGQVPQVVIDDAEREPDPYFDPDYDVVDPEL